MSAVYRAGVQSECPPEPIVTVQGAILLQALQALQSSQITLALGIIKQYCSTKSPEMDPTLRTLIEQNSVLRDFGDAIDDAVFELERFRGLYEAALYAQLFTEVS